MTGTAFGLGMPVACTAIGLAAHLGWVMPWDGRRSLRATVDIIMKDVEVDEQRQHIPAHAQTVLLFNAVLRSVAEDPDHWRSRLSTELPFVDGSPLPLSAVERARLDRYIDRLATALGRYGRRVRFGGGRVAQDVAGVIFDPRSYWNAIDLTGSGGDAARADSSARADLSARPDPSARAIDVTGTAIDVTGTGAIDVRTETRGRSRAEQRAEQRAGARARSRTVSETASRTASEGVSGTDSRARPGTARPEAGVPGRAASPAPSRVESGAEPLTLSGLESGAESLALGGVGAGALGGALALGGLEPGAEPLTLGGVEPLALGAAEPLTLRGVESGAEPLALGGVESGAGAGAGAGAEPLALGEAEPLVLGGGEPGFELEPGTESPASSGAALPSATSGSTGTGGEQSEAWSDTGIRSVAGVELGIRAGSGTEGESASGAKPDRRGPRRRSRH